MPKIEHSNKLSLEQEEKRIVSKPYIFYRVIVDRNGGRLMTATAAENFGEYRAFENQELLIATTATIFNKFEMEIVTKQDHAGRPYIETQVSLDEDHLHHVATTALERMGFEDVSVLALREMKKIYEDFAVDDSGDDIYLSDGMYMTADGKLVEK